MAVTYVEIEDKYQPKTTNKDIKVHAEIGDGQGGGYLIFLNQKFMGNSVEANLGKANDVNRKWIIISSTVIDKLDETNWTSLTIYITEGDNITVYGPYKKEVQKHLDTVCYIIKILNSK